MHSAGDITHIEKLVDNAFPLLSLDRHRVRRTPRAWATFDLVRVQPIDIRPIGQRCTPGNRLRNLLGQLHGHNIPCSLMTLHSLPGLLVGQNCRVDVVDLLGVAHLDDASLMHIELIIENDVRNHPRAILAFKRHEISNNWFTHIVIIPCPWGTLHSTSGNLRLFMNLMITTFRTILLDLELLRHCALVLRSKIIVSTATFTLQ